MTRKTRIKTDAIAAPATREEAEQLLATIGGLQRYVTRIESEMNDKLLDVKELYTARALPLNNEIEAKFHALHVWAEANRTSILKGKLKTAKLATGEVLWRMTPKKVNVSNVNKVIEALKLHRLKRFIRTKEEINKEAILADESAVVGITGIKISQVEEFVAKPFDSQIERAEPVKKVKGK